MSWKNQLRPASFRGVSFGVEAHQSEQGRRKQVHEYPGRDDPYVEDLGKKAATFALTAFVVGADYMAQRDRLLEACNQSGAAQLVHPYLGTLNVECTAVTLSETASDGGMARFDLEFVIAGRNQYPAATEDVIGGLLEKNDLLNNALGDWFGEHFKIDGLPDWLQAEALTNITGKLERLQDVQGWLDSAVRVDFSDGLNDLLSAAKSALGFPADFAVQVLGLYTQLSGGFNRPLAGIRNLQTLFKRRPDYSAKALSTTHLLAESLQQGERNRKAVDVLFEVAALNAAVATAVLIPDDVAIEKPMVGGDFADDQQAGDGSRVAAKNERQSLFESLDEAIATRKTLLAWLDSVLPDVPDEIYSELVAVRQAVVQAVPDAQAELPRLRTIRPLKVLPVLALAYSVHGDAARSAEMLRHNAVAHPGFMPAAELRVLSD